VTCPPPTFPALKTLGKAAGCLLAVLAQGCLSLTTPEYVLRHRDQIQEQLKVNVDISDASSFTGDVGKVLADIEKLLAPLPEDYRKKIARIKVVDGFLAQYTLRAPFVGGFTRNDGTVFVRNANITKFLQGIFLFPRNDALIHEILHSVHFWEMRRWHATGQPSPEFAQFVKGWECQYFGDVNSDGEVDDRDVAHIERHVASFDFNRDGVISSADVELAVGKPYVQGRWASLRGVEVLLWMGFQWLAPRPAGFATPYAKTYVWEDAAETKRYLWRLGLVPALYSNDVDEKDADRAWKKFRRLKRKDPLLARKVFLVVRYIAAHEKPDRLSSVWTRYVAQQSGKTAVASAGGQAKPRRVGGGRIPEECSSRAQ